MFKQPAENTNATPTDEQRSQERVNPQLREAEEHEEIKAEALRLASERDGSESYNEEDWNTASRIVRNRRISLSKA